jgi:hypothetical protein
MRRPAANKPAMAQPLGFLARKGLQRLVDRIDQRVDTLARELLWEAMASALASLATRQAQRLPVRTHRCTRTR